MGTKDETALVCYCLVNAKDGAGKIDRQMQMVQELFEGEGFDRVLQAFTVNRSFPASVPFQEYPQGFRAQTDPEAGGGTFLTLENLVLSYGLFRAHAGEKKQQRYFLVLLREGETEPEDQELLEKILVRYRRLKEKMPIYVICLAQPDDRWEGWEQEFADVCGIDSLKLKQPFYGREKDEREI